MAPALCKECGARPKESGRHRCLTCRLRHEPIDVQVAAARFRLGLIPLELQHKRVHQSLWPAGQRWCAGCQSFRDLADMQGSQCRACKSAAQHGARIAKLYNLTADEYDALLALQGGKCAICRRKPKSKRLAVDHDHKTNAVRGLLCSRCNHDLMGAAWDSLAMAKALLGYLEAPPATGNWTAPEMPVTAPPAKRHNLVGVDGPKHGAREPDDAQAVADGCMRVHYLPSGSESWPGHPGYWRIWRSSGTDTPPF